MTDEGRKLHHYECPITNRSISLPCQVKTCMYHDAEASIKGCKYAKIQEALSRDGMSKDLKKRTVCQLFSLSEDELGVSVRRVVCVLHASEYFEYVYEKSIMDARSKELEALKQDQNRYLMWRPSAKKIPFEDLIKTLDFLRNNIT